MHTQQNSYLHFLQVMWLRDLKSAAHDVEEYEFDALAPAVLLDRALALGTLLRIALDPVCRLAVVAALFQPERRHAADDGSVVAVDRAAEAEAVLLAGLLLDQLLALR